MASHHHLLLLVLLALASFHVAATDPTQLQDFCVADLNSNTFVNGFVCKNPGLVTASDFFISGLNRPGNSSNQLGSIVKPVFVTELPGLNTLSIALGRLDFEPYGVNPPHTHPRGSEILMVQKGTLAVGFVTSNPDNRLFTKVLKEGDAFVFPQGLIHFQLNIGKTKAVAFVSFSSQNPGIITVGRTIFGSQPRITPTILEKAFQLDEATVKELQAKYWTNNT